MIKTLTWFFLKNAIIENDFEEALLKKMNISSDGKTMGNVRNRLKLEFILKVENEKVIKRQSKLVSVGIHKVYTIYDGYTIKQNWILMDKPIYLGCAILELS